MQPSKQAELVGDGKLCFLIGEALVKLYCRLDGTGHAAQIDLYEDGTVGVMVHHRVDEVWVDHDAADNITGLTEILDNLKTISTVVERKSDGQLIERK